MTKQGKDRITITLRKDLLPLLDGFIDGEKIRNRSHAIEYILGQHLGLGIHTAVILAAAPDTKSVHALTRVQNRPVIAYQFDMLKANGIRNVILVVDENSEALRDYLGDGKQWGLNVQYIEDSYVNGTAHALRLAKPYLEQTFLLLYSDALIDINLSDFVEVHRSNNATGTIALSYSDARDEYGVARLEGTRITSYTEKPGENAHPGLVNAGLYLFEPAIFDYLSKEDSVLETALGDVVSAHGLYGYPFSGGWFDVSKEESLTRAQEHWSR